MSVILFVIAALVAAGCFWGSRALDRKAAAAVREAARLRHTNQMAALQFANNGGVEALCAALGTEERLIIVQEMARDGAHPYEEGHYVRRLCGLDFESIEQGVQAAEADAVRYVRCRNLCRVGYILAAATALATPFLRSCGGI